MIDSIAAVHNGKTCMIPSRVALQLAAHLNSTGLTTRETQVLDLLADGRSNKEIGRVLGLTEGTIKLHVNHILRKLKAESRTEAVSTAIKKGLVRVE